VIATPAGESAVTATPAGGPRLVSVISMRRPLLLVVLGLAALAAAPAAAPASSSQVVAFEAPRELLDFGDRDRTLDEIQGFGVANVRQLVYWKSFAPKARSRKKPDFDASDPNAYPAGTWDRLDALVGAAQSRGIALHLTLTGPVPKWATGPKRDFVTRPKVREFGRFATAVGRRYGAAIGMWSIWNEPNQPQFLSPQYRHGKPYSPGLYRRLYKAARKGLRSVPENRDDQFLVGETSPRGNRRVVHPLVFLRRMLCLNDRYHKVRKCGRLNADGYAHHAYTTRLGPRWHPPTGDVTMGVIGRLEKALDRAGKAGAISKGLGIYLTEFGIQSIPDEISGVSLPRQAAYLAIAEHMAYVNPRVRSFSQYLMNDDSPRKSGYKYSGFESGLRRANGKQKPSYKGFRLPLAVERYGSSDVLWGLVRPLRARTTVTIEVSAGEGEPFETLRQLQTTSTGVFALTNHHRSGQRYRVHWRAPSGQDFVGAEVQGYRLRRN
jgi:hypothetical protein